MEEPATPPLAVAEHTSTWAEQSLDLLVSLPGVRRAALALLEGGGRRLTFTSAVQAGERPVTWCHVDAYDDVPLNTAVRSGRAVVGSLGQLSSSHPGYIEGQRDTGSMALAAVPLVDAGQVLGGFVLFYCDAPPFSEVAVHDLYALGARLGGALRRAEGEHAPPPASWVGATARGTQVVQFTVPSDPAAVGVARRELRDALAGWDVDNNTTEIAALCMSELVTNAMVHAGASCSVHVTHRAGSITVAVRNSGAPAPLPEVGARDPLQVHGRGLQLVDALASSWGSDRDREGFTAWFVLAV